MANILIVDDAAFMRMMMKDILSKNGYTVVGEAENGIKAVEKYKELQPDLVIMDITMPEMDGIQSVKHIKEVKPEAKIIMCSAMGQQAMVIESIQAGARDFIVKPFQAERVLEAVKKLLDSEMAYFIILFTGEPLGCGYNEFVLELLGIILIFCCVLYLAYVASRLLVVFHNREGKHIQVVEQIGIGLDRQLLLIRAGTDHYLFVSSKKELKMVAKVAINDDNVDMEVATQSEEASGRNFDFRQIFDKYLNTAPKQMKKMKKHIDLSDKDKPLKENISRLQHMQKRSYMIRKFKTHVKKKES